MWKNNANNTLLVAPSDDLGVTPHTPFKTLSEQLSYSIFYLKCIQTLSLLLYICSSLPTILHLLNSVLGWPFYSRLLNSVQRFSLDLRNSTSVYLLYYVAVLKKIQPHLQRSPHFLVLHVSVSPRKCLGQGGGALTIQCCGKHCICPTSILHSTVGPQHAH